MANDTATRFEITLLYPENIQRPRWEDMLMREYGATQIAHHMWECDLT
jgi:hypothetical protein